MSNDAINEQLQQSNSGTAYIAIAATAANVQAAQSNAATGSVQDSYAQNIQSTQSNIAFGRLQIQAVVANSQPAQSNAATGHVYSRVGSVQNTQAAQSNSATGFVRVPTTSASNTQPAQMNGGRCTAILPGLGGAASTAISVAARQKTRFLMQLPKVPPMEDKQQRNWAEAVSKVVSEALLGDGQHRALTVAEALAAGAVSQTTGGVIVPPTTSLIVPPKVTGLSARGAMTTIILNWNAPSFSGFGLVEVWRSDKNNIGEAFKVGSSSNNFFQDPVGTGATKYYWVRAVTSAGVAGEFNAADGTIGQTSLDPTYVMRLLTSQKWEPNTSYLPYQYVRPIPADPDAEPFAYENFQYVCLDGGTSGVVEPAWPTTVGNTVMDGTIEWQCRPLTEKVPFTVGVVNGQPAVVMSKAFIEDASINTAQIHDLAADKITAGKLRVGADIEVGSKIWGGFSDFDNPLAVAGFWLGLDGGVPRLAMDTGGAPGVRRFIRFNGSTIEMNVDIFSGADGYFDDLLADSLTANRASIDFLSLNDVVVASDKVRESPIIPISEPEYLNYLCFPGGVRKTESNSTPVMILGTGYSRPFAFYQTPSYTSIVPYNWPDATTKYRARQKNIGFTIKLSGAAVGVVGFNGDCSYLDVYILSESQSLQLPAYNSSGVTDGVPSTYLAKIPVSSSMAICSLEPQAVTAVQNSGSGDVPAFEVEVIGAGFAEAGGGIFGGVYGGRELIIRCPDDEEWLGYAGSRRLKVAIVYKTDYAEGPSHDTTAYGQITVDFQIDAITPYSYDAENDPALAINSTVLTPPLLTPSQNALLLQILANAAIPTSEPL